MDLQTYVLKDESEIPVFENVVPLCELAKGLEEAGEFELAEETLRPFWRGLPLSSAHYRDWGTMRRAELLLRTGTLAGWIGSARQISGAQEIAKDLISESASIFGRLACDRKGSRSAR